MTLLYVGNELLVNGKTPSSIDTLSPQLREFCEVITTSKQQNPVLRLVDMCMTIIIQRKNVDYILIDTYSTNNFYFALLAGGFAKFFGIKYFTYLHGGNLPYRLKTSPRLCAKLFNNSQMNLAPSGYLLEAFRSKGYKVEFIPNNIDINVYPYKERNEVKPNLLFVRSFSEVYNPYLAINAFSKIKSKYPDAKMCMVGPDKDGTLVKVKDLTKNLGLTESIEFTGKLSKVDWIKKSEDFDIFINPTNFDNQPVSIIEAMALGMPIVSTNVGGLPYLIDNEEDGLLVNPGEVQTFANAIERIIKNKDLACSLSKNSRNKAQEYDWNNVSLKWKNLFHVSKDKYAG